MKDIYGNEIEVGDIVAAPFVVSDTPVIRAGKVVELVDLTGKLRVEWTHGPRGPAKPTLIKVDSSYWGSKVVIIAKG